MDEQYDPEMDMWKAAVAAFRERQSTLAEAIENANLLMAAYRRHQAELQCGMGAEGHDDPEPPRPEEGAEADPS